MTDNQLLAVEALSTALVETHYLELGDELHRMLKQVSGNPNTTQTYRKAFLLFIHYLDLTYGDNLPEPYQTEWRPFVTEVRPERRGQPVEIEFRVPAAILCAVKPHDLEGFGSYLSYPPLNMRGTSVDNRIAAIRRLLRAAADHQIISPEQYALIKTAPTERRSHNKAPTGRWLSIEQSQLLRSTIRGDDLQSLRDRAIIDCMLLAALRREEIATLRRDSIRRGPHHAQLYIQGKGDKPRKVKIIPALHDSLQAWLNALPDRPWKPSEPLFVTLTRQGALKLDPDGKPQPLKLSTISKLVSNYGVRAGIGDQDGQDRLTPHDLRRTAARIAYEQSKNLTLVQKMLGHADINTTMIYIGISDGDESATDYLGILAVPHPHHDSDSEVIRSKI